MESHRTPSGVEQRVTSSDLVRSFGIWQDRAARAPVYVLHRGRPRLVLTSLELMDSLCAPHRSGEAVATQDLATLLDTTAELYLLADRGGVLRRAGAAARRYFGASAQTGAPVAAIGADGAPLLADAIARVVESGIAEEVECVPAAYPSRRLSLSVLPAGDGVVLHARDLTMADELADGRALDLARGEALMAAGGAAEATVNLRGYCERPAPTLAALTGVPVESLATARFVTLFAVASRVAVGEAMEQVLSDGRPRALRVELLRNRQPTIAIRLGMAARRCGAVREGVVGILARDGTDG